MRFVIATAAFVVAAVMIGLGLGQRTIWAPAPNVTASANVTSGAPYIVITGSTLNANEGQQTLELADSTSAFVAYGRTADVIAWIGDAPYEKLGYDRTTASLTTTEVNADAQGDEAKGANPNGSDLWLEQFTGARAGTTRMNVPDGVSVIIATDGTRPAPAKVSVTWPADTRTPWAGPLMTLGGVLAAVGVVAYIAGIRHMRRGRGPRRGGHNGRRPRLPKQPKLRQVGAAGVDSHGRRSVGRGMIAVPVVLVGALALSGCSSDYWPSFAKTPTSTPTSTPLTTTLPGESSDQPAPVVTEPQLRTIVTRIATVAKQADAARNATLAATRFTGAALRERQVNYKIRAVKSDYAAVASIPTSARLYPVLPQATDTWPRVVDVIVSDTAKKSAAPLSLVLTQETPRDEYKVAYAVTMLGGARIPDLAPANIGAAVVPLENKLLKSAPGDVAAQYATVLAKGAESDSYKRFEESDDALTEQVGAAYKAKQMQAIADKKQAAKLTYVDQAGIDTPVALATNDAGALLSTTVRESQTATPTDPAASISLTDPNSATAALIGSAKTDKGVKTDYEYQLLFYVPPAESSDTIRLLGFTQAVIGASQVK